MCGTGGGKTTFSPAWLHREILRCGQGNYLAASSTFPVFMHSFLPAIRDYFCRRLKWGIYKAGPGIIEGKDGSQIFLRSGTDSNALESGQFKAAVLDEWGQDRVPIDSWEAVNRRVARFSGRVLIPTTPYNLGWLKQQIWDRWKGGDPRYEVVNFRSIDNPVYPLEAYERARRELPDWKFQMFYNGIFTRPAGMIYEGYEDGYAEFSPIAGIAGPGVYVGGGNLVKAFTIPREWMRDVGIDFGESANCARLWVAEDPSTHYGYVFRDQLGGGLNGPEYAKDALDYHEDIRIAAGGAKSEQERRDQWAMAGLAVAEPLISEVEAGIDHTNALFKGRRWFVFDTCTGIRSELGSYSRELDAAGEPTEKIADKTKWHRIDALRYVASFWPQDRPEVTLPSPWTARAEDSQDRESEILKKRGGKWY